MRINVLSLTIKTLSFMKAKQACLSTHNAIERLEENSKIQKKHINTGRLAIHFSLSVYQTTRLERDQRKLVRDSLRMQ